MMKKKKQSLLFAFERRKGQISRDHVCVLISNLGSRLFRFPSKWTLRDLKDLAHRSVSLLVSGSFSRVVYILVGPNVFFRVCTYAYICNVYDAVCWRVKVSLCPSVSVSVLYITYIHIYNTFAK